MKIFCCLMLSFLLVPVTFAKTPPDGAPKRLFLRAEVEITVDKYDHAADVFIITNNAEPDVGPNYTTPENLQRAIEIEGSLPDFMKKMSNEASSVYVLKQDLPLLWQKEVEARKKSKKN